jgi:hypothetical protein
VPGEILSPETVRLVHLTDLHYGRGFNRELWEHLKSIIPDLNPHVIFVTGDLVNSPWWWRCRRVRQMLDSLKKAPNKGVRNPSLYVIPGNHDTRLQGILPIVWIVPLVLLLCFLIGAASYVLGSQRALMWVALAGAVVIAARYVLLTAI